MPPVAMGVPLREPGKGGRREVPSARVAPVAGFLDEDMATFCPLVARLRIAQREGGCGGRESKQQLDLQSTRKAPNGEKARRKPVYTSTVLNKRYPQAHLF